MLNNNAAMLRWLALTIEVVVRETSQTETSHWLKIERGQGTGSPILSWGAGYPMQTPQTLMVEPWEVNGSSKDAACALIGMKVAEMLAEKAYPTIPCALNDEEKAFCKNKDKIGAIRAVRKRWTDCGVPMGLRDAKDSVDAYIAEHAPNYWDTPS